MCCATMSCSPAFRLNKSYRTPPKQKAAFSKSPKSSAAKKIPRIEPKSEIIKSRIKTDQRNAVGGFYPCPSVKSVVAIKFFLPNQSVQLRHHQIPHHTNRHQRRD